MRPAEEAGPLKGLCPTYKENIMDMRIYYGKVQELEER